MKICFFHFIQKIKLQITGTTDQQERTLRTKGQQSNQHRTTSENKRRLQIRDNAKCQYVFRLSHG